MEQVYATPTDLDAMGLPETALASVPSRKMRTALRAASARVATYLRKKHKMLMVPSVGEVEVTSAAGTGSAEGRPTVAAWVVIEIVTGGTVGAQGIEYKISTDDGATFGSTLSLSGSTITIDDVTVTLAGTFAAEDRISYDTGFPALREPTVCLALGILFRNRGVDSETAAVLRELREDARAWLKDITAGEAEIDSDSDSSPELDEGGTLASNLTDPYAWYDVPRGCGGCG